MLLGYRGMEIPKQCEHDPNVRDKRGMTVAMWLTYSVGEIPKQWEHDPTLQST